MMKVKKLAITTQDIKNWLENNEESYTEKQMWSVRPNCEVLVITSARTDYVFGEDEKLITSVPIGMLEDDLLEVQKVE